MEHIIRYISNALRSYFHGSYTTTLLLMIFFTWGCIEPYDFMVKNDEAGLVVEGFISDVSYNQTLDYPSDGRFFSVKLTYTSDVINIRGEKVIGANVQLIDDSGNKWQYTEMEDETYALLDPNFRAISSKKYQLNIALSEGQVYESAWVKLPEVEAPEMGAVSFTEEEVETYVYIAGEEKIRTIKGMHVTVELPENNTEQPLLNKWTYDPTWVYVAPLARESTGASKTCWAKNNRYLNSYDLREDFTGGYKQELFFMETEGNERIFEMFSVLIIRHIMNEEGFYFWKELKEMSASGLLLDKLPYDLATNIQSVGDKTRVSGYFGAVKEQATRWYFNKNELSYKVLNDLQDNCLNYGAPGPPAAECLDCIDYSKGSAVAEAPFWWSK